MGLGSRIRHYRTKLGLTLADLSDLSEVDTGTISAIENRDSSRSQYFPALAKALGLTVEQLDDGRNHELYVARDQAGRPTRVAPAHIAHASLLRERANRWNPVGIDEDSFELPSFSRAPRAAEPAPAYPTLQPILAWEHEEDLPEGEFVLIRRLDVHLSAGGGRDQVVIDFAEKTPIAFRADWIRKKHLKPSKIAAMTASGDSMEDRIYDGDLLAVDTSQREVIDGKTYALWYEGGERVKVLFRLPGGGLRIHSRNTKYPDIVLKPEELEHVRIIGRVVHIAGEGGL